jgi:hypothetical protein
MAVIEKLCIIYIKCNFSVSYRGPNREHKTIMKDLVLVDCNIDKESNHVRGKE